MKKNFLIFSVAFILYFFTKVGILILSVPIEINISLYSVAAYVSLILYIIIFAKLFKILNNKKPTSLPNVAQNLYSISILLLSNSILASVVEIIKMINIISLSYDKSPKLEIIYITVNSLLREVGLIGYLTLSLCFFLVTKLFNDSLSGETKN